MAPIANESLIAEAGRRLAAAAPGARVILFGSYARGEARPGSDLELLVVEPRLPSRRKEFGRLRMALGDIGVPVDLIVVSDDHVSKWGEVPGGVIHEALRGGRVSPLEPSGAAAILARKAAEDATAVREFAPNPEIADGIIGFHVLPDWDRARNLDI